jgi:hypothetical protein
MDLVLRLHLDRQAALLVVLTQHAWSIPKQAADKPFKQAAPIRLVKILCPKCAQLEAHLLLFL